MSTRNVVDGALMAVGLAGLVRFVVLAAGSPALSGALVSLAAATLCAAAAWLGWFDLERQRLVAEARGRLLGAGSGASPGPGWRVAAALGALFLIASLVVGALLEGVLRVPPGDHGPHGSGQPGGGTQRREAAAEAARRGEDEAGSAESIAFQAAFPVGPGGGGSTAGVSPEAFPALYSTRTVLEIEELDGGGAWRPPSMHVRAFTMDRFGPDGAPVERTVDTPVPVPGTGPRGLTVQNPFGEPLLGPDSDAVRRDLEVRFVDATNAVVFSPRRLARLDAGDVLRDDGATLLRLADRRQRRYRLTTEEPRIGPRDLRRAVARGSRPDEPHLLALPPTPTPAAALALGRLGERAARWSSGRDSDAAKVMAVVTRLRADHGYLLQDTRFTTPAECLAVLDRGAGSCTQFASAAMIMLRSLGIPTRIAVGYLVTATADDDPDVWLARECDGHAWIEVHFEGLGWLTFDPTPADELGGGALTGWAPVTDASRLAERPRSAFGAVAARTVGWLTGGDGGGVHWRGWGLGLALGAAAALALRGALARRAGGGDAGADGPARAEAAAASGHAPPPGLGSVGARGTELLAALATRGHAPSRNETTLAFARRVGAEGLAEGERVAEALTALLRCSCMGLPLEPSEERAIADLCRDLVQRA